MLGKTVAFNSTWARYYSFQPLPFLVLFDFFPCRCCYCLYLNQTWRERERTNIKIVPNDQRVSDIYAWYVVHIEMLDDKSHTIDKIRPYYIDKPKHMQRYVQRYIEAAAQSEEKTILRSFCVCLPLPLSNISSFAHYRFVSKVYGVNTTKQPHLFYVQKLLFFYRPLPSIFNTPNVYTTWTP